MKCLKLITLVLFFSQALMAAQESMSSMPQIKAKSYTVQNPDQLNDSKGFGDDAPMVKMMNLMMVEGSGYEGMDMGSMKMAENQPDNSTAHPSSKVYDVEVLTKEVKVGRNTIEFNVKKNGKVAKGLKIKALVYMTSMDMGTDEPQVKELASGKYQVKAAFSMKGPWALKLIFSDKTEDIINFDVKSK